MSRSRLMVVFCFHLHTRLYTVCICAFIYLFMVNVFHTHCLFVALNAPEEWRVILTSTFELERTLARPYLPFIQLHSFLFRCVFGSQFVFYFKHRTRIHVKMHKRNEHWTWAISNEHGSMFEAYKLADCGPQCRFKALE